jgi:hypothetical protein
LAAMTIMQLNQQFVILDDIKYLINIFIYII